MFEAIAVLCTVVGFVLVFVALIQADRASRSLAERRRGLRTLPCRYSDRRRTALSNPKKPVARAVSNPTNNSQGLVSNQRSSR